MRPRRKKGFMLRRLEMPAQKIFAAAALAGALVLSSVPASAADRSAEVRYGDLDLTSQADVALLKQRVALAVKHVCGNANIRNLREVEDMKHCRAEASTRSHNDVELALENARNGTRQIGRASCRERGWQ